MFDSLVTIHYSATLPFLKLKKKKFILSTEREINNSFHRKDLVQIYQSRPYFKFRKYFFIHKNPILGDKMQQNKNSKV